MHEKTFSITRRVIAVVLACQVLFAAGLVLLAAVYADTQLAFYAGVACILVLLAESLIVIRTVHRSLAPVRGLAERAGEISTRKWNLRPSPGAEMATELVPLVQAFDAALARLQTSYRQQRDFTGDAAHELKTSVAVLKSTLQLLLQRPRTQREYEIGLEELLEDCARLEDLLTRMLRLARIEQQYENGLRPDTPVVNLVSTCEAAISRLHALAEEHHVALDLEATASVQLLADPDDLELLWTNLLENAVQYSPPGSTVKMRVGLSAGSKAQIFVQDSGPGIPAVELTHIYERFRRGASAPGRLSRGFGLGLAICKALADAYGGTIEARNLPERGAEFRVDLPLQRK
jgi:signal transduction histidine kinase